MQIRQRVTPAVLAAATGLLQPFVPELSPQSLVAALRGHEPGDRHMQTEKQLTRRQAAALLGVSIPTVDRYMRDGILRRVKIGKRLVRIDPASVRALLDSDVEKEAANE